MASTAGHLALLGALGIETKPKPENIPELMMHGWTVEMCAETYGVTERTIYRYLNDPHQCFGDPKGSCLTKMSGHDLVRKGGLCSFCSRTRDLRRHARKR